jgi:histidinol-phosphate aminotransferase
MFKLENLVRKNILSLQPYASARDDFQGTSGVFLDANENPFGDLNRYPDPYQKELKKKLVTLNKVKSEEIFIGNGSDEVIDLAFRIFCNPGSDKALTFSPTYGMYDVSAGINDINLIKIPLTKSFQIDMDPLGPFLKDPALKLIFICSPNNPTGNSIDQKDIERILNTFSGIVIIDEAYIDFSDVESRMHKIKEYPNLIVCQTFSKARGLAAARVGVAYADSEIIKLFNKVKPPYNVSELNQKAAMTALENQEEFLRNIRTINLEKSKLVLELFKIKFVQEIYPSEANFLLIKVKGATKVYKELVAQKIITRNRTKLIKNCIRISIGTPSENIQLLTALNNIKL